MWPEADQVARFTSAIVNNTAIMFSNGSVKGGHGSNGWKLAIQNGLMTCDDIQKGVAPVDCNPEEQPSTRCELSRVLEGLTAMERVTLGHARGTITAGCDSSVALSGICQWIRT